jgi:hypothetical protein
LKRSSKKLVLIGVACAVALGGVVYGKVKPHFAKANTKSGTLTAIYGANPNGTTLDILKEKVNLDGTPSDPKESKPLTSTISQDFAQNYLTLKNTGALTPENQAMLITTITMDYSSTSRKGLDLSDIYTFSDREKDKIHIFGNSVARTVISYFGQLQQNPITMLADAEKNNATTSIPVKLGAMAKTYRLLALDLQQIPAPATLAAQYLGVINGYVFLADDLDNLSVSFTDPARGLIGGSNYQKDIAKQIELLKNIHSYFETNGILYSNTEEGAIWSSIQ